MLYSYNKTQKTDATVDDRNLKIVSKYCICFRINLNS